MIKNKCSMKVGYSAVLQKKWQCMKGIPFLRPQSSNDSFCQKEFIFPSSSLAEQTDGTLFSIQGWHSELEECAKVIQHSSKGGSAFLRSQVEQATNILQNILERKSLPLGNNPKSSAMWLLFSH